MEWTNRKIILQEKWNRGEARGWKGKTCRGFGVDDVVASSIIACWKCVTTLARASSGRSFSPASRKSFSKFPPLESIDVLRSQTSSSCHRTKGPPVFPLPPSNALTLSRFGSRFILPYSHPLCDHRSMTSATIQRVFQLVLRVLWHCESSIYRKRYHELWIHTTMILPNLKQRYKPRHYEFSNDTTKDIMSFEILEYTERHREFWNLGTISMGFGTALQASKRQYEFSNDTTKNTMSFEILEYLERHREFWNLGTISMGLGTTLQASKRHYEFWNDTMRLETAMSFIIWISERHHEAWNDTTKLETISMRLGTSFETTLWILKRYEPWNPPW